MGMEHRREMDWMMMALDGELTPQGQEALEDHLEKCADCRVEWDRLSAVDRFLHEAPVARVPAGFTGRVLARVDRRRHLGRTALGGMALVAGTTFAALLAFAPALWSLSGLTGDLPLLLRSGGILLARLVDAAGTVLNSLWLTAGALALPVVPLALCGLFLTLAAGLVWLGLVRRLQPAAVLSRR